MTVESTHAGITTIETRGGNDMVGVQTLDGHTRILAGDGNDRITVSNGHLLSGIDAQLLISGGSGTDTTIVDDSSDAHDVLGTLTQTSLVGRHYGRNPVSEPVLAAAQRRSRRGHVPHRRPPRRDA